MPTLRANFRVEIDGEAAAGFPVAASCSTATAFQQFRATKEATEDDRSIPVESVTRIYALLLTSQRYEITARINGLASGGVVVNGGGSILIFGTDLNAGAANNVRIVNDGEDDAPLIGFAAGLH